MKTQVKPVPRNELRDYYVPLIEALLKQRGKMTREAIAVELGLNPNTAAAYLHHMYRTLRIIRRGQRNLRSQLEWQVGADFTLPADDEDVTTTQRTVPARQLGMARDALVAALFGAPVQGASAC